VRCGGAVRCGVGPRGTYWLLKLGSGGFRKKEFGKGETRMVVSVVVAWFGGFL
jgi:hypothetical protein